MWKGSGARGRGRPTSDHVASGLWEGTPPLCKACCWGSSRLGWSANLGFREPLKEVKGVGVCLLQNGHSREHPRGEEGSRDHA